MKQKLSIKCLSMLLSFVMLVISCPVIISAMGDGTVQLHSATIANGTIPNRVFYRYENTEDKITADHVGMINGDDKCLALINAIISEEISTTSADQLEERYGAYLTEQEQ